MPVGWKEGLLWLCKRRAGALAREESAAGILRMSGGSGQLLVDEGSQLCLAHGANLGGRQLAVFE